MGNVSSSSEEPDITALAEIVRQQYPEELTIIGLKSLLGSAYEEQMNKPYAHDDLADRAIAVGIVSRSDTNPAYVIWAGQDRASAEKRLSAEVEGDADSLLLPSRDG